MAFRQLKGSSGGGNYVKWDTPKTVKGRLVGFIHGQYKGKPTTSIKLRQDDGTEVIVNGSAVIEGTGLYQEQPGVMVEFVFKGKVQGKGGGNPYNDIDVFVDSPEPDPSTVKAPSAPSAPASGVSEYDTLVAKLTIGNPKGAAAMVNALAELHPDMAVRTEKLRAVLKEAGIA